MLSAPSSDEVHQGSKLTSMHTTIARWDHDFERQLTHRLRLPRFVGHIASPVLCVGARLGAEVKAFRAAVPGLLSVGTDYNPGNRNPYVMWGDAHSLQFSPNSLAVLYTNVLDHIRNTSTFAREAHRVLRPNGTLWVEMDQNKPDNYAIHDLQKERLNIVQQLEARRGGAPTLFTVTSETLLARSSCSEEALKHDDRLRQGFSSSHGFWHFGGVAPHGRAECVPNWREKDVPKFVYLLRRVPPHPHPHTP